MSWQANPVRDLSSISAKPRASRALSVLVGRQLLAWVTNNDYALAHDAPDLLALLVASGDLDGPLVLAREQPQTS
jgi:hypothetical protein